MALPTQSEVLTMDYAYQGIPMVRVEAKAGAGLEVVWKGTPFMVQSMPIYTPPPGQHRMLLIF
jgi:hypothetical protein